MAVIRTNRTRRGWARPIAGAMIVGLMATHVPTASAQPTGGDSHAESTADGVLQSLVREVTERERTVSDLELKMGSLREDVNRANVDLGNARREARRAGDAADEAKRTLGGTRDDLRAAQGTFDDMARAAMRQGYSLPSALGGASDAAEVLDRSSTLRREADKQGLVVDELDRARTEAANADSTLREMRRKAEEASTEAERLHGEAERAFKEAERLLNDERIKHAAAVIQRDAARAALDAARIALDAYNRSGGSSDGRSEDEVVREAADDARDEVTANGGATESDAAADAGDAPTVTPRPSQTDESAADTANGSSGSGDSGTSGESGTSGTSGTGTDDDEAGTSDSDADASESDAETTTTPGTTDGTGTNGTAVQTATPANPESPSPTAGDRSAKIETVISRAMSQIGVPYAWGGGNANGPTKGIRDGGVADAHGDYNKVGFDCSGLTLYAYAGIGINLPHYTGYQYQRGTHYPASQMERGDLIFYGPNGHGHVAIYLGNGQMIEAPQSGSHVRVTAVRYNGMTPNVVRLV
ncbi:NlpC/P60 family protein [Corynebacterium freneyi]|uniref:Cell wall-associated NlpC family hydrolase n=1 Tax=Corynebacterium freneyi TaxID=134034 RepID=A0ABS4U776_9CORY|nr:NlpC/P60 family protein [Corynebacterium freneyi]MBP2332508.1 cell wall-associated NlpC family hydrolase [Corynebacterium freneyi]WJZ05386.1 Peptidoglycan endopeptidase RipA precursor [Corynebacterium freneyi]